MVTTRQSSIYVATLFAAFVAAATVCNAFSLSPMVASRARIESTSKRFMSDMETMEEESMVTLRSLNFVVESKPLGIVLEEMADGIGVFAAECDLDGAAYQAGIRDGDVLASLDGDESIMASTLDGALALLGEAPLPLPIKVYRELEAEEPAPTGRKKGTVKLNKKRLPSAKKLLKASTNKNFWNDPLMIGSAVLTVAMPLGIFAASSMIGK